MKFTISSRIVLLIPGGAVLGGGAGLLREGFHNSAVSAQTAPLGPIVPPQLVLPGQDGYTQQALGSKVTRVDGQEIAQFQSLPVGLNQTESRNLPTDSAPPSSSIAFQVVSSIRYGGNGSTVTVTTAKATPAALQRGLILGAAPISLANGSQAWTATGIPTDSPNQVVFLKKNLIITVTGGIPLDKLEGLASIVVLG